MHSINIGVDERMFAQQVHDARNATRVRVHCLYSLRREELFVFGTGDIQAGLNIVASFLEGKRLSFAADSNPLLQLAQLWPVELRFPFRLARENYLQQFSVRRL